MLGKRRCAWQRQPLVALVLRRLISVSFQLVCCNPFLLFDSDECLAGADEARRMRQNRRSGAVGAANRGLGMPLPERGEMCRAKQRLHLLRKLFRYLSIAR